MIVEMVMMLLLMMLMMMMMMMIVKIVVANYVSNDNDIDKDNDYDDDNYDNGDHGYVDNDKGGTMFRCAADMGIILAIFVYSWATNLHIIAQFLQFDCK